MPMSGIYRRDLLRRAKSAHSCVRMLQRLLDDTRLVHVDGYVLELWESSQGLESWWLQRRAASPGGS